jgi:asparagine synthase (glutamine-hydrolysing)
VLLGGRGEPSIKLLERAASAQAVDRTASFAVVGVAGATEGKWRCWISGRVTNTAELWGRFPGPGRVDLSSAIARAHTEIGPAAGHLLRGTFVLAAVDLESDVAYVSRDQLGGRPLIYTHLGNGLLFAEHEKYLLDLLPSRPAPDGLAVGSWVDKGRIPRGHTLYDGMLRLPPGHQLVLSRGATTVRRYWSPSYESPDSGSRLEMGERLRESTFAAVDRAAAGSRRTAVRLSGGLDSACVAAGLAARRPAGRATVALSAVFPQFPGTDERALIEATARKTGLPSERVAFDDDGSILPAALRHIDRWSLPPMTPNLFVWEPVMAHARRLDVDVMLDGEGGDELFSVAPFLIADMLGKGRFAKAWSLTGALPGIGNHPDPRIRFRALRVFGLAALAPAPARRWRRRRRAMPIAPDSVLSPQDWSVISELEDESLEPDLRGPIWWQKMAHDLTGGIDALDVSGHMQREAISEQIDRRHPFLFDLDLVDTVLAIPPQMQFDPKRDRPLLRDALDGYIPDEVRCREGKSHFTPPLIAALESPEVESLCGLLARADAPIRSYVSAESLDRLLEQSGNLPTLQALRLWRAAMADTWLRAAERPGYPSEVLEKSA